MAHPVKCTICGEVFDRDRVECVNTATRRYAHKSCYNKEQGTLSEEERYRQKIFDFTQNLFEKNFNKKRIESQLNRMIKENVGFTYSGVFKTLVYWYEVKRGDVEKSHYSINIVPYVYNDAKEYYRQLWMVQQLNADKDIEAYKPKTKVITIPNPVRQELIKRKKFEFLKEEGE